MPSVSSLLYLLIYLPFPHLKFKAKILQAAPNKFLHVSTLETALNQSSHCLTPAHPGPTHRETKAECSVGQRPSSRLLWDYGKPLFCCCYCVIISNKWLGVEIQMSNLKQIGRILLGFPSKSQTIGPTLWFVQTERIC